MLSRWNELSPATVDALRRYLLDRLLQTDSNSSANGGANATPSTSSSSSADAAGERLVRTQLLAAHACILKRAWGWASWTDADRGAALAELEAAAAGGAGARAAAVALSSLEAVVSEFAPATASPLGQPWEYHELCRASLQREWLPRLCQLAIGASAAAAGAAVGNEGNPSLADLDAAAAADAALSLASTILSWDFYGLGSGSNGGGNPANGGGGGEAPAIVQVSPTKEFRDLLLRSPAVASLLAALPRLQAAARASVETKSSPGSQLASRLFASARQLVVLLCGLDGPAIFSPTVVRKLNTGNNGNGVGNGEADAADLEERRARREHSSSMLRAVLPWAWPPLEAARAAQNFDNDGAELADAARALGALAAAQGASVLSEVPVEVSTSTSAAAPAATATVSGLSAFAELAVACLSTGGSDGDADGGGGPAGDASAVLLDGLWDALSKAEEGLEQARMLSRMAAQYGNSNGNSNGNGNGNGNTSSVAPAPARNEGLPTPLPAAVVEPCARVFSALVSAELASAAAGATEDEDEGEATAAAAEEGAEGGDGGDSGAAHKTSRAAAIAHASTTSNCTLLSRTLAAVRAELARASASGTDPSVPLEQLVWLTRTSAAVLAEAPDDGEPSLRPRITEASFLAAESNGEDPALGLSSALLEVAAFVGSGVGGSVASNSQPQPPPPPCSPRLLEALSLSLARWAATFLLPDLSEQQKLPEWKRKPFSPGLISAFGGTELGGQGEATLAGLARLAVSWLASTPGETDLHSAVAKRLLPALERRREAWTVRKETRLPLVMSRPETVRLLWHR